MSRLLLRAKRIGLLGEVPVSAVVLDQKGRCIGYGSNERRRKNNPLGHAEIIALRQAALVKNDWRFNDCTLMVTLEPCPMCAGAILNSRLKGVVYGVPDDQWGSCGSYYDICRDRKDHSLPIVVGGILAQDCKSLIDD